jgi:hypothetical protein
LAKATERRAIALSDLTPAQRRVVLALIAAQEQADARSTKAADRAA